MKHVSVSTYQTLLSACAGLALFVLFLIPSSASALEVQSRTAQLLPPNGNSCAPVQISNFTPFVYADGMDSFEFTVSDPAYVAVAASIGNTSVPFHFMSRWPDAAGGVRIHVDTAATPLTANVPVVVTLLSARTGAPVCATVIAVDLGTGTPVAIPPVAPVTAAPTYTAPVATVPAPSPTHANTAPSTHAQTAGTPTTAAATASATSAAGALKNPFGGLCASAASAYRLWLILLIAYALLVGGLLWLEFPLSWSWAKTPERVAMIILGALILLLAFWYLSATCRAALWMPLLAFLIAVLGLLAAFWNHPKVTQLLLLEEKSTIVTPPPANK